MLQELIYTSLPRQDGIDVRSILKRSRENNPAKNITGLLCFDGNRFLQILEGDEYVLEPLYEAIKVDSRHKDIELLYAERMKERSFTSWAMAYESLPFGQLGPWIEKNGVMSILDAKRHITETGENFGSRLFKVLFQSTYQD